MAEKDFRLKLSLDLEERFNWEIYHHEKYKSYSDLEKRIKKFNMKNAKGYPDLYCLTDIEEFPIIAIETKVSEGLGIFTKALDQLEKYVNDEKAVYLIDNEEVEKPEIFLIASPDSYYNGYLYVWSEKEVICGDRWVRINRYVHTLQKSKEKYYLNDSKVYKKRIKINLKSGELIIDFKTGEFASNSFDFLFSRILWRKKCAILKSDHFQYNNKKYRLDGS